MTSLADDPLKHNYQTMSCQLHVYLKEFIEYLKSSTRMGFEPTRGDPNGLAVHGLNHSATSSVTPIPLAAYIYKEEIQLSCFLVTVTALSSQYKIIS